jgi:hypothetical protein
MMHGTINLKFKIDLGVYWLMMWTRARIVSNRGAYSYIKNNVSPRFMNYLVRLTDMIVAVFTTMKYVFRESVRRESISK